MLLLLQISFIMKTHNFGCVFPYSNYPETVFFIYLFYYLVDCLPFIFNFSLAGFLQLLFIAFFFLVQSPLTQNQAL